MDASEFLTNHPGGLRKLLSTDKAKTGATGKPFGFSFSSGRNAHFPDTGKRFRDGGVDIRKAKNQPRSCFLPTEKLLFLDNSHRRESNDLALYTQHRV